MLFTFWYACHTICFEIANGLAFKDGRPAVARVLQQRRVEEAAADGASPQGNVEGRAVARGEERAGNYVVRQGADLAGHAEPFQRRPAVGIEDVTADFVSREMSMFDHGDGEAALSAQRTRSRAGGTTTNYNEVEFLVRICHARQLSAPGREPQLSRLAE